MTSAGPPCRSAEPPRTLAVVGGTHVVLRPIAPSDAPLLHAAFHALSPESRYLRFLGHLSDLTPSMLRYLCEVDGRDHVAYVAVVETPAGEAERIVGVARFVRARDEIDTAEIAITVADELHGFGLGTLLLESLAHAAATRGIRRFTAYTLRENRAIRHVLAHGGATTLLDDDTLEVRLF